MRRNGASGTESGRLLSERDFRPGLAPNHNPQSKRFDKTAGKSPTHSLSVVVRAKELTRAPSAPCRRG
jgi:hypothetical protein